MSDSIEHLENLGNVFETLYSDLGLCREELRQDFSNQYRRRLLVREFCTFVEVTAHYFKRFTLYVTRRMIPDIKAADHITKENEILSPFTDTLSPVELLLLEEQIPMLDENGGASSRRMIPRTAPNIRFAFAMYLKIIKTGVHVDFSGDGWRAMEATIGVRNRLTHPKRLEDLVISDKDIDTLVIANDWLLSARMEMIKAANLILERTEKLTRPNDLKA